MQNPKAHASMLKGCAINIDFDVRSQFWLGAAEVGTKRSFTPTVARKRRRTGGCPAAFSCKRLMTREGRGTGNIFEKRDYDPLGGGFEDNSAQLLTMAVWSDIYVLMQHPVQRTGATDGAGQGDVQSVDALFASAYQELRKLARVRLRGGGRNTVLDTTSLVHESYLRLSAAGRLRIEDRTHFLHYAGSAMRSVIVDFVRRRQAGRRAGGADRITLTTKMGAGENAGERQILRVHEAIDELAKYDSRMAEVVEMRYFGGLTETEIAEALAVTDRTVRRYWEKARLWLSDALK